MFTYGVQNNLKGYQIDIRKAFLHTPMKDIVYVSQIPGFPDPKYPSREYCFQLTRAVYGTKQAAKAWYDFVNAWSRQCMQLECDAASLLCFQFLCLPLI